MEFTALAISAVPVSEQVMLQPSAPLEIQSRQTHSAEILCWVIVIGALFFLPTWAAAKGRRLSVFLVNTFFGWTLIGWAIALIMAVRSQENAK